MKMQKLYTCATAWHWDVVPEDDGAIAAYTALEHVLDGEDCARECGVIELEVARARALWCPGRASASRPSRRTGSAISENLRISSGER